MFDKGNFEVIIQLIVDANVDYMLILCKKNSCPSNVLIKN